MSGVGSNTLRKFLNQSLLKMHVCAFTGFLLGVKTCDYFFYNEQPYNELQEDLEDQYWEEHGKPTELEPYTVQSYKENGGERKSWIYIMYEKDQLIKKKDEMD